MLYDKHDMEFALESLNENGDGELEANLRLNVASGTTVTLSMEKLSELIVRHEDDFHSDPHYIRDAEHANMPLDEFIKGVLTRSPIIVASHRSRLFVLDGQHRVAHAKKSSQELLAFVFDVPKRPW